MQRISKIAILLMPKDIISISWRQLKTDDWNLNPFSKNANKDK